MTDLHITNGDGAANLIKQSRIAGDVLPWRDPMHHGPFPADHDLDALSQIRARYLAGPDAEGGDAERDFRLRDDHLRAFARYGRVILWFEHDLLDQLQILQLLDWFAAADLGDTRLEIICISSFPGIDPFRGIGQLTPEQTASLIDQAQPVSPDQFALATAGWAAFRSADPRDLQSFAVGDLSPLPFLKVALSRHLEEYPDTRSGLTRTEHQILTLASNGVSSPSEIFAKNMDCESAYFIGDWSTFRHISELCAGAQPLLNCGPNGAFDYPPLTRLDREAFRAQRLTLSETGAQVLSGQRYAFDLLKRDHWLGGVHLFTGAPLWTWDAKRTCLALHAA